MVRDRDVTKLRRRHVLAASTALLLLPSSGLPSHALERPEPADQFEYLNAHERCDCSTEFTASIGQLPATSRLQGSCCHAMDRKQYAGQIEGLKEYSTIPEVPPDPYDVAVSLAQKLISYYDLTLSPAEQQAYDYAVLNSREKGPCCCQCWRWSVYGGLAKFLIRSKHFGGNQITAVWNLSDACGGGAGHR